MDENKMGWPIHLVSAIAGNACAVYVYAWMRSLMLVFGMGVYTMSILLSAALIGVGAGGWMASCPALRKRDPVRVMFWLAILAGVLGLASKFILGVVPAAYVRAYFSVNGHPSLVCVLQFLLGSAVMAGPLAAMGMAVPVSGRIVRGESAMAMTLGGAAAGVLAVPALFIPSLGLGKTIVAAALCNFLCGGILFLAFPPRTMKWFSLLFVTLALSGGFLIFPEQHAFPFAGWWLPAANLNIYRNAADYANAEKNAALVYSDEHPGEALQVYSVKEKSNEPAIQRLIVGNKSRGEILGLGQFLEESQAMLAVAARPNARRCLVLGLGAGALLTTLQTFLPEAELDCVESRGSARLVDKFFYPRFSEIGKYRLIEDDAIHFLRVASERYDVVFSRPTPPYDDPAASFLFTDDFYRLIAARLAADGTFVQGVSFSMMGGAQRATVIKTFAGHFPFSSIYEIQPGHVVFIGRLSHLGQTAEQLIAAIRAMGQSHAGMIHPVMNEFQFRSMATHSSTPIHTADLPVLEYLGSAGVPARR